ncbi:terpene synthase family protein [Streptomyces albireticuli]|uniref:terpene synthase family protein n=1 Tax=Streptomyces albireticuli TaxID=1940 RepID=UPI00369A51D0
MSGPSLTIPELYCPFPASTFDDRPHPAAPDVSREIYALIDDLDGGSSLLKDAAAGVVLGDFMGRIHPAASPQGLGLAMMCALLFFGHDDWIDQRDNRGQHLSPLELNESYDRALKVYDGDPALPSDPLIARLLEHFGAMVRAFNRPADSLRIRMSLEGYLRTQVWELDVRSRREIPPLPVYQAMRRNITSSVLYFDLYPLICDLHVPAGLLNHPVVQQLRLMHADYCSWANDLLSLEKELKEDGALNLAYVLQAERGLPLQQAIDAAAEMVRNLVIDYLGLKARLPHLGIPLTGALAELLDEQERAQSHFIAYQQRAPRFKGTP